MPSQQIENRMEKETLSTFNRRKEQAAERMRFCVPTEEVAACGNARIVKQRNWYGVAYAGRVSLLPVFDEASLSEDGRLALGRILDVWQLYDATTGEPVVDMSFSVAPIFHSEYHTVEIITPDGLHGLLDTTGRKIVVRPLYDEVGINTAYPFVWVRKGSSWGFVEQESGKEVLVDGVDMVYETEQGCFFRQGNDIVSVDSKGVSTPGVLRHLVVSNNGRGCARNSKYHETVVFDVYGKILS